MNSSSFVSPLGSPGSEGKMLFTTNPFNVLTLSSSESYPLSYRIPAVNIGTLISLYQLILLRVPRSVNKYSKNAEIYL